MLETIKEYLVSLGFHVDESSLNAALRAMRTAEGSVASFSNLSVSNFAKAATGVVAFVATANLALSKYLTDLAQADLQTEMFARRMWMSKDAAKAYQSSIDALGVSLNDLYLSPELMQKYLSLNSQSRDMAVPADEYNKQMQGIRDITFQFQRLKLEGTYALQWIGYYLTKYLAGPMGNTKDWLTKINDTIQQKMPEWTKKVALVASWFVRLGVAAWNIRDALLAVAVVFTGIKMASMLSNPFGLMILGLTALLLLVDDFMTYQRGGKSAFPELWKWVEDLQKSMKDSGVDLEAFKKSISGVVESAVKLGDELSKLLVLLGEKGGLSGLLSSAFINTLTTVRDIFNSIAAAVQIIAAGVKGMRGEGWEDVGTGYDALKKALIPDKDTRDKAQEWDKNAAAKIKDFISKYYSGDTFSNAVKNSQGDDTIWAKLLGNTRSSTSHTTISPTYNIYGASQPGAVAQTVHKTTSGLIRTTQGAIR